MGVKFTRIKLTKHQYIDRLVAEQVDLFEHLVDMHGEEPTCAARCVIEEFADRMKRIVPDG